MAFRHKCLFAFANALFLHLAASQYLNPSILQDSRDLPKVDGTFGFLYRTEDGIAHAAKGDANGVIHGRFSYTDPTGLKVNYNYNAGSRVAPGYDDGSYDDGQYQPQKPQTQQKQPTREDYRGRQRDDYEDNGQYEEPQYVPRSRPALRTQTQSQPSSRRQYSAQYRQPVQSYEPARTRPQYSTHNELYDDYNSN